MDNIRILPFDSSQNRQHLFQLKPDLRMLLWLHGYDDTGKWTPSKSKAALAKYPLVTKKNKPKSSSSTTASSDHSSGPATKSSTSSKSKNQKQAPPDKDQSSQSPSFSQRIMRRFPLNLAHAIPLTPDRVFKAYFVPYDGHCLFQSFKDSIQLQSTIHDLRNAVVRNISEESNPQIRISALNTHIAREQNHRNPAWHNVNLLDAGTVLVPGEMDIQFSHLWVKYADEMSDNAWAGRIPPFLVSSCISHINNLIYMFFSGQPEIMALCKLHSCNCIVWEVVNHYGQNVFSYILNPAPPNCKTVHLHLASKQHYETTDIPQVLLFLSLSYIFLQHHNHHHTRIFRLSTSSTH